MESEFEIADRKELATIAKICLEKGLKFNEPFRDSNYDIVKLVSKLFGYSNIDLYDVEFICAFIIDNYHILQSWIDGNLSYSNISSRLKLPQIEEFEILYQVSIREYVVEYYKTDWKCFKKEWVEDSITDSLNEGSWDYFSESPIEREVVDSDNTNFRIESVKPMKDLNTETVENNIIKLLSENTENVIENFDRKTLLNIKKIIDTKLKSL